jgi:hypothetical protein
MALQRKVWDLYSFIKGNLYLCMNDMSIGSVNLNSALLFSMMTSLNGGRQLLYGEYGHGKTTSAENIISLLYGYPSEIVLESSLKGNPEINEEKIVGRPDLGKLNQGYESVIWSDFVLVGPKIIDELNRMIGQKQTLLLEGADRGNWKYLNGILMNETSAVFATVNYRDSANFEINQALLDRFSVAVEAKHPGQNNMVYLWELDISKARNDEDTDILRDKEITSQMVNLLRNYQDIKTLNSDMLILRDKYRQTISKKLSLELLADEELKNIRKEISKIPPSKDAKLFYGLAESELSSCMMFGQKRSNEECAPNCRYHNYLCGKVSTCMSVRSNKSLRQYSQTLAWLLGSSEFTVEHLATVMPFALWHKIVFKKEYMDEYANVQRGLGGDPLKLYVAKESVESLKKRFSENKKNLEKATKAMYDRDFNTAQTIAKTNDHPVFQGYLKF